MGNFDHFNRDKDKDYFDYLDKYDNEKLLYDLVLTEAYNLHGVCMTYYTTTYDTNYNRIWGEDNDRRFERKFEFMALTELPKEEDNWTKFGIEPFDTVTVWISKRHFNEASKYDYNGRLQPELSPYIPKVSDIIKTQYNDYYYEVVDVGQEEEMFHREKHSWELTLTPYKNEHISASSPEFDDITNINNNDVDVLDITSAVDVSKIDIVFSASPNEKPIDRNQNGWW